MTADEQNSLTLYERVGEDFFETLADNFYQQVITKPVLKQMYPEDLLGAKLRLKLFLIQFWGGPTTYSDQRGHPRLRMRHIPFTIDLHARNEWIDAMKSACDSAAQMHHADRSIVEELMTYFDHAATFMINVDPMQSKTR